MLIVSVSPVFADGIYRDGVGARAISMGGADAAYASDPLGAMAANPAGLGFLAAPEFDLSLNAASAYGQFSKSGSGGGLDTTPGFYPDAAFALPLGKTGVTVGLSFVTDCASDANWHYTDPRSVPGGITYGYQRDKSEIVVLRTAVGAGFALNNKWSIGANFGFDYNQNTLQAPYIFQNTRGLAGDKVLLDLRTSGFGWNAETGVLFRPRETLQFGLTYKSPTTIFSHGDASGNAGAQLGLPPGQGYPFGYDAEVKNVLPQMVTGGASWKFHEGWRLALQMDWINWADAFTQLPVSLSNGHTALPASINDSIPLDWRNQLVYRGGLEYFATRNLVLRGGYCYGNNPVPSQTATPLTAAIIEQTLTAGAGYYWSRYRIDIGYQWGIPKTINVGTSGLRAQEYSQSSIRVGSHTFVLTMGVLF